MSQQSKEIKTQISFSIRQEILEAAEDTLFYLRKELSPDKRKKLTKSILFEVALMTLVSEYKDKRAKSSILKSINELINLKD
jgi:predicted KAP-like P-loop ATPase